MKKIFFEIPKSYMAYVFTHKSTYLCAKFQDSNVNCSRVIREHTHRRSEKACNRISNPEKENFKYLRIVILANFYIKERCCKNLQFYLKVGPVAPAEPEIWLFEFSVL